ncbi:Cholinephosphotransferase 1 [Gossypium arboreum]|uniref:Cholinephosphotransferase 1 n=1 Tax=Gossypium arboreum TaxID=29729 RepID=A0A0B0MTR7_GOSAR|nr:Cholinephosphotransferase 1 [Gossypium arboreum]
MVWMVNQQVGRGRSRTWGVALLCWLFIMLVTPKIPLSYRNHLYADMRNFVGVPNTLNVITNFPFLIVGVLGFVLCLGGGSFFNIRLPGEMWGWLLFYGGTASVAFGSAYYHLRPDDNRVLLDTLPLIPCIAIPIMTFLFPPKYTHSRYWLWTVGVFILAKMEALADMKIYRANNYIISGHSLEHLCSAIAPVLVTVMLMHRSCRFPSGSHDRLGEIKECP